jgi:hypothetical protein
LAWHVKIAAMNAGDGHAARSASGLSAAIAITISMGWKMHKPSDFNHWKYWMLYEWREWNPYRLARKIGHFAANLWAYRQILWHDRDFDYVYLLELMELKLGRMGKHFADHDILVSSQRTARECRVAAEICRRIAEDDYPVGKFTREPIMLHQDK